VQSIGDIALTAEELDVTTLDAGEYRDFIPGFKDPGECELTVIWDPGLVTHDESTDGLWGLFQSGASKDCAIRYNSSAVGGETFLTFQAFIRDMTVGAVNPDDPQTMTPLFRLRPPITLVDTLPTTLTKSEGEEEEEGVARERRRGQATPPARPARRARARAAA
jgi:hypothetical protein